MESHGRTYDPPENVPFRRHSSVEASYSSDSSSTLSLESDSIRSASYFSLDGVTLSESSDSAMHSQTTLLTEGHAGIQSPATTDRLCNSMLSSSLETCSPTFLGSVASFSIDGVTLSESSDEMNAQIILRTDQYCEKYPPDKFSMLGQAPSGKCSPSNIRVSFEDQSSSSVTTSESCSPKMEWSDRHSQTTFVMEGFSLSEEPSSDPETASPRTSSDAEECSVFDVSYRRRSWACSSPSFVVTSESESESERHTSDKESHCSSSDLAQENSVNLSSRKHPSVNRSSSERRPPLSLFLRRRGSIPSLSQVNPVTLPAGVRVQRRKSLGTPSELSSFLASRAKRRSMVSPTGNRSPLESLPEDDMPPVSTDPQPSMSFVYKSPSEESQTSPRAAGTGGHLKRPLFTGRHRRRWSLPDIGWIHERLGKLNPKNHMTHAQVQRVSQYDKYVNELYNRMPPHHADAENLKDAASTVRSMVKDREDEVGQAENENKLQQVQERFPNDDLLLMDRDVPKEEKFKAAAAARRRSAPTTVLRSALNKVKTPNERPGLGIPTSASFTDRESLANMDLLSPDRTSPTTPFSNNNNRQYIMEAPVQCTTGLQSQCRYLFLFNDLLVIAKPNKSASTFRLKQRLRVSELWMATCLEDVCEVSKPADRSFVLGWPTTNVVLTFSSLEERNLWWHCLEKHIDTQRDKEELKTLSVRVINKENKATAQAEQTQLTLQVGLTDSAKKLLGTCLEKFSLEAEDVSEYQLWVRSSKEAGMYPLIGHELPYAIKMSHLRDVLAKYDDLLYPEDEDQVLSFAEKELPEHKCQFILRRAGKTNAGISIDTSGVQKRFRKAKKSPFKLSFKRSMSNKPAEGPLSPTGKLFGIPLPILCPDNSLPKPIIDLIMVLYNNGPFFTGVFRKSANARVCREVRAKLDNGEDVCMEELPIPVAAALFKEFLRSLPESVFECDMYENWINANNVEDVQQRIEAIKSLLDKLPPSNVMVLHHVFCMLHYIDLHNDENNMNAHNLSICVAPSMIWPPLSAGAMAQAQATKKAPVLVEFMIEHSRDIFGEDVVNVFGDPPIRKERSSRHYSSGDSDSLNSGNDPSGLKRDDSSLESIERELYEHDLTPSPRTLHWPGQVLSPSTLSRDSGLTSSNNELYPESEASSTDSGVESKKETSGSNSSMGSQTGLRHSRSAGYVPEGLDINFLASSPSRRRVSEPPAVAFKGKRIVVRGPQSTGVRLENSPDTSDNEVEISPETFKMLQDVDQESSLKLFSEIIPHNRGQTPSPRRPHSGEHSHMSDLRHEHAESVRPKSLHVTAHNSPRGKWHSPSPSSSSEGLFPAHAMPPHANKPAHHEPIRRQLSNSKLQRAMPVTERPKTLNIRPMPTRGAQPVHATSTPPREFFPRDATQASLAQNPPQQMGVLKSQSDTHIIDGRRRQRDAERERIMSKLSPIPDSHHRGITPPSYQEAMNRRALLKHPSVDNTGLQINSARSQWHRSRPVSRPGMQSRPSRPPLRTSMSQDDRVFYDDSHRVESGIIYLSSDSESSDEDTLDAEHLRLHKSHPANTLKAPSVRRTSSDRTKRERVSHLKHSQDSLKRSSSDRISPLDSPSKGNIFFSQNTTLKSPSIENKDPNSTTHKPEFARRITSPLTERRGINELVPPRRAQIRRSSSVEERQSKQKKDGARKNSTTSADSGNEASPRTTTLSPRTALHFPFPDPHAEPPKSPSSQPKSREDEGKADRVSELRSDEEFKQKILQARRNWHKHKQAGSADSGACVDDLDSIEFTEESYV